MRVLIRRAAVIAGAAAVAAGLGAGVAGAAQTPSLSWSSSASPAGSYGTVAAGSTTEQTFTLANSGGSASAALRITVSGPAFAVQGDNCTGTSLGPNKSCTVTVAYTASTPGGGTDTGTLTAAGKKGGTASLALSGVSQAPASLTVTVTSSNFDCGKAGTGSTCWEASVSGSGLAPYAEVDLYAVADLASEEVFKSADANGNFSGSLDSFCGGGWSVYAVSTTTSGTTITSNTVSSPCG